MKDHSKLGSKHYRNVESLLLASPKQTGSVVLSLVLLVFGRGGGVQGSKLMLWLVVHMTIVWGSSKSSKMKGGC